MNQDDRRLTTAEIFGTLAFATVAWFALVIVGLGVATILFNRDIINDPRAGVGLGPAMVFGSLLAFTSALAVAALRRQRAKRSASPYVAVSILSAFVSYFGYLMTTVICWIFFVPGNPADAFAFAAAVSLDWPAAVIAVASLAIGATFFAYLSWRLTRVNS